MDRKVYAVFVAGGSGTRMGARTPKQFMKLNGVPVLQRTIERFYRCIPDLEVITVLPRQHFATWRKLCLDYDFNVPQTLVEGGITRFHSVRNALERIDDMDAVVMIHDGVRPLVTDSLLQACLDAVAPGFAALPVIPVTDTLRYQDCRLPDPDRSQIDAVQTPQTFIASDIRAAYSNAYELGFTDDVSVAIKHGLKVRRIPGLKYNIKLTTPEDIVVAEQLISICLPDGSVPVRKK